MSADRELSPAAAAVVQACERLVSDLRYTSSAAIARNSISDLKEALPALETALAETRHAEMLAAVAAAAGAALTHEWVVTNAIRCPRCSLTAGDAALARGAVPECGSGVSCTLSGGHFVVIGDGTGSMRCTYCKMVYPVTASEPVGGAR